MFENESDPTAAAVAALRAGIDGVAGLSTMSMDPDELHGLLVDVVTARTSLDAVVCAVTTAADRAGVQTVTGQRSLPASIGSTARVDPGVVAGDRKLGRWVDDYPEFRDAFADGVLSRRHVEVLRRVDNPRTTAALFDAQGYLIAAARDCTWRQFKQAVRYWELAADPDGTEPEVQREKRRGSILTLADGTVKQTIYHEPITGSAVKNAVETRAKSLWAEDQRLAEADHDFTPRTHAQRIADASAQLQIEGYNANAPAGAQPLIHIVMSQRVAEDALARLHDPDGDHPDLLPIDAQDINGRCELADGTPIHPQAAIAMLANATLRRMVMGPDSEILDLGRTSRGFPRKLHQALLAAGRGQCAVPGCAAPTSWLEADHIYPWSKGGITATTNGQMLCGAHNKAKSDRIDTAGPTPDRGPNGPPTTGRPPTADPTTDSTVDREPPSDESVPDQTSPEPPNPPQRE